MSIQRTLPSLLGYSMVLVLYIRKMNSILEWLQQIEATSLLIIFAIGVFAFILSTISGGGGALILVPVLNWLIGISNTAPVLNLGTFIGRPVRLLIFRKHIHWRLTMYYIPGALIGAWAGGWFFFPS